MKNLGILLMIISGSAGLQAQNYKPFKVNISVGYAKPNGKVGTNAPLNGSGGLLLAIEPKYGFNDKLEMGLRLETTIVRRGYVYTNNGQDYSGEVELKGASSAIGTLNYFLSTKRVRPYVGVGAGLYYIAGTTISFTDGNIQNVFDDDADYKFGAMGRVGLKAGHLNVGVEYNYLAASRDVFQRGSVESQNSYLSLKLGVDIGGGRK